jgi:hypothetical protein
MKKSIFTILLLTLVAITATTAFAQKKTTRKKPVLKKTTIVKKTTVETAPPAVKTYAVDTGTRFRVRMNGTISSKTSKVGDTFTTTTLEPIYSNTGAILIPSGSTITGRIDVVKPAAKGGVPGEIEVTFITVNIPNGTKRTINGSLAELDTKTAKSDNEGTASGDKMKYRKPIFIGGGATGGAIIGGVIGGGVGAAIGAGAGALGGLITERKTKGEEATVKSGTEFAIVLNQTVSLPKFVEVEAP